MVEVIKKNFRKVWLFVFLLALAVIAGRLALSHQPPTVLTLQDVLEKRATRSVPDPNVILAFLLTFSFAALSAAKGYEIFRRNRSLAAAVLAEPQIAEREGEREITDLKRSVDEFRQSKEYLLSELANLRQVESLLRRSGETQNREIARLKEANETLTLKKNSIKLPKVGKVAKRSKKRK